MCSIKSSWMHILIHYNVVYGEKSIPMHFNDVTICEKHETDVDHWGGEKNMRFQEVTVTVRLQGRTKVIQQ